MKQILISCALIFICCSNSSAQFSISGKVVSQNDEPIAFAVASVYPLIDSTAIKSVVTSEVDGSFKLIGLQEGEFKLAIQMLGYEDWSTEILLSDDLDLGILKLNEEAILLQELQVVAEQSTVQSRLGKKVLRIGKDLSTSGSNVVEALEIIPSVSTTAKGQIQIRGNSNVIIYINGKETKRDPATLKFISAEVLEKIEVITNPSAKYDAEGVGGIINLVYKKGKAAKFKVEAISNVSVPYGLSGGLNASLNKNKFSLTTNVSLRNSRYTDTYDSERSNAQDSLEVYKNLNTYNGNALRGDFNIGIAFEPDTTLGLGLELNYDFWDFTSDAAQTNLFFYKNNSTPLEYNFSNVGQEIENELWVNFSLTKKFKSSSTLKIALSSGGEDEKNFEENEQLGSNAENNLVDQFLLRSDETESQRYYQVKADFESNFFNFGEIEAGFKADIINYDILQAVQLRSSILNIPDNDYSMDMQKFGAYVLHKHQISKIEYAVGLRLEQFLSEAIQRADDSVFKQDYLRLFPSIQVNYWMPDQTHTIGFNYARRINRPGFFDLNPFISYADPLNLETGNPALRPEIANLYELTYHKGGDRSSFDLTFYRRETNDAILATVRPLDGNKTLEIPMNFANQINQGIEGQIDTKFSKSFKNSTSFVLQQVEFKDELNDIQFQKNTTWTIRLKQQIKLPNDWKIDLTQSYRAPRFEAQLKRMEVFYADVFIGKKFKNKKGNITLGLRDIFNTRKDVYFLNGKDFQVQRTYKWQTRRLTLGLRYLIIGE